MIARTDLYRTTPTPAAELAGCRCSTTGSPHVCPLHKAERACLDCRPVQGEFPHIQGGQVGWLAHRAVIHNERSGM